MFCPSEDGWELILKRPKERSRYMHNSAGIAKIPFKLYPLRKRKNKTQTYKQYYKDRLSQQTEGDLTGKSVNLSIWASEITDFLLL